MRLVKMLGLAVVSAIAAMAFVGASSALATQNTALCKIDETPCSAENRWTELHAIAVNPTLLVPNQPNITCNESLAKATVLGLGTAPNAQIAHLTALTWTHCLRNEVVCEVETRLLGLFKILRTAVGLAEVASEGTTVLVKCGAFIHCSYKTPAASRLHGLGAELPTHAGLLSAEAFKVEKDNAHPVIICPNEAFWDAKYQPLEDVFITS